MIKQKLHTGAIIGGIVYVATCAIIMIETWFTAYLDPNNVIPLRINSIGERDLELGIHIVGIMLTIYLCYAVYKQLYYGRGQMIKPVVAKGE